MEQMVKSRMASLDLPMSEYGTIGLVGAVCSSRHFWRGVLFSPAFACLSVCEQDNPKIWVDFHDVYGSAKIMWNFKRLWPE